MTDRHDVAIHVALAHGIRDALLDYGRATNRGDYVAAEIAALDMENLAKKLAEECAISNRYWEDLRGFSRVAS